MALREDFDGVGLLQYAGLSREQGLDAGAQARPIGLGQIELTSEIEERDLAHLFSGALGGDETEREISFVRGFTSGRGFADEHGGTLGGTGGAGQGGLKNIMALQNFSEIYWRISAGFREFVTVYRRKCVKDGLGPPTLSAKQARDENPKKPRSECFFKARHVALPTCKEGHPMIP